MKNSTTTLPVTLLVLVLIVASMNPAYAQTWRSQLYPEDWQPLDRGGSKDAQGRFLHDFSYAGYAKGEQDIPNSVGSVTIDVTQPPYTADNTGSQDATASIQTAIDDAVAQGGGTVYLPSGTYKLTTGTNKFCLRIAGSNVLLKGDGPGNTFLFADQQDMRQKVILLASPFLEVGGDSWFGTEQNVIAFTQDVNDPTSSIVLQNVNGLSAGDWIMLRADLTSAWADEHGMLSEWGGLNNVYKGTSYYRQITAVDASTKTITIDIPTRYWMKTRDNARVYKLTQSHISNVGFTGFSIGQRQKNGSGFGSTDYSRSNTAAYDIHQAFGVAFNHVVDGWLTNVETYRPSVNTSNHHLPSNGVMIHQSRNVTVADNRFSQPQYKGGGGNGNTYMVRGSDNLIANDFSNDSRHGFNGTDMWCSGNVYKDCEMINGDKVADFHRNFTHANLVENFSGDGFEGAYRPYGTNTHGHTASQSVFWRFDYVNNRKVKSQQWGWGYVIGADAATIPSPTKGDTIKDFEEGTGLRSSLRPISLYEDQLDRRLNGSGTGNPGGGQISDVSLTDDAFVRNGQYSNQNYGNDANLTVKDGQNNALDRRSFLRFDLSTVSGALTEAELVLHVSALANEGTLNRPIELRKVNDDTWQEGTITWSNQPTLGSLITAFTVSDNDLNQTISLDVTDFIAAEQNNDEIVSFALVQPTDQNASVVFSAKESAHSPVLQVTTGSVSTTTIHSFSSQQSGNEATQLIDGTSDVGTNRWSANGLPQWVIIDYGINQEITGTRLWTYQNRAYRYKVELSRDLDFTGDLVVDRLSNSSTNQPITDTFAPVTARYAKLTVTGASGYSGSWVSLHEFALERSTAARHRVVSPKTNEDLFLEEALTEETSLLLYPNPASRLVQVRYHAPRAAPLTVRWTNLAGQLVQQQVLRVQEGNNSLPLDIERLPHGLYVVSFATNGTVTRRKLQIYRDN